MLPSCWLLFELHNNARMIWMNFRIITEGITEAETEATLRPRRCGYNPWKPWPRLTTVNRRPATIPRVRRVRPIRPEAVSKPGSDRGSGRRSFCRPRNHLQGAQKPTRVGIKGKVWSEKIPLITTTIHWEFPNIYYWASFISGLLLHILCFVRFTQWLPHLTHSFLYFMKNGLYFLLPKIILFHCT